MKNTKINYLYRDADNYKMHNEVVVKGKFTPEMQDTIKDALECGEYFIPSQVGLPEKRFDNCTDADHCFFELDVDNDFVVTDEEPTVELTAEELTNAFANVAYWDCDKEGGL